MSKNKYVKNMQKAGIAVSVVVPMVVTMAITSPTFAATATPTPTASATRTLATGQAQKITNLKQRADNEIDKRVTSLTSLIAKLDSNKRLAQTVKDQFKSDIQKEIDSLKALKVKIDADTDVETLKTDVKSIVDSYRIYLLYLPKTRVLIASDAMNTAASKLSIIAQSLDAKLKLAESEGKDTKILRTSYNEMIQKIKDAQDQYDLAEKTVLNLTPSGYPDNKTQLEAGRDAIKSGTEDLKTARNDAKTIFQGLKSMYPSTTPTVTPKV